jgi:membrane protease YdiL (CAAX protease family)
MPALLAAGWVFGVLLVQGLLLWLVLVLHPGAAGDLVSGFACQAVAYLLGLFLILRVHAPALSVRALLGVRKTHPAFYPIAILSAAALTPPIDRLFDVIQHRYPHDKPLEHPVSELFVNASTPKLVLLGVIIVLIGPILEEMFFRGALFNPIERGYPASRSLAVGITALLFATAHFDHQELLPLGLIGVVLGLLRQMSGSLIPSTLLHMSFNGLGFYFMMTAAPGAEPAAPLPRWIIAGSSAAVLALLGLAHLLSTRTESAALAQKIDRQ